MSLFPVAATVEDALKAAESAVRSKAEARLLAGGDQSVTLETEWLTVSGKRSKTAQKLADLGLDQGFIQAYENADGEPVLAVTYWKTRPIKDKAKPLATSAGVEPVSDDHTDDLYFRQGRTKVTRGAKEVDKNQLDLFNTE